MQISKMPDFTFIIFVYLFIYCDLVESGHKKSNETEFS